MFVLLEPYISNKNLLKMLLGVMPVDIVDRIFALVDQKYDEQRQFALDLGVPPSRISEWRARKSTSYNRRLDEISKLLGTTTDYLLKGEISESAPEPANKSALMAAFWGGEKDLSQEELNAMWDDVERFAQFIAEKKKQEKKNRD